MNNQSPNLDALRSVAVTFVVISHLLLDHSFILIGSFHSQTLGTLGVLMFFVHTCLVLMQSLERHGRKYGHQSLTMSFLVRRAFRIYPMSMVVVVVLSSIDRIYTHTHPTWSTFLSNFFLVQNLTDSPLTTPVLWSLPFEFQMYLLLPSLYLLATYRAKSSWGWIITLWFSSIALVYVFWRLGWRADLIKFFPCFLPGVLAYCLRDKFERDWSPALLFAYVGAVALVYPTLVGLGFSATFFSWFICLALGVIIPKCREMRSKWVGICAGNVARYSYGIYLLHYPLLYLSFHYLNVPTFLRWTIFICAVPALSYLTYHLIERPGIEFGQALADRMHVAHKPARA